ncbi:MAG: hypothetical protein U0U67_05920 [Chitinophagales bacterium]
MQPAKKAYYKAKYFLHKLANWEYWPQEVVYFPMYPLYALCAAKARHAGFFVTANPHDGEMNFVMESKIKIYSLIPKQYYPTTIYVEPKQGIASLIEQINKANIAYPFITKPNIGQRGIGVKKIYTKDELMQQHQTAKHPYLIQQLINYQHEIGLFYVRYPNEEKGKLTGIVYKEFLQVTGNGKQTLEELIYSDARTYYQLNYLQEKFKNQWNDIIPKDKTIMLVPFGNHVRGSKFLDYSHKITPKMEATFNNICSQIHGYYFGRMDVKFDNWQDLEEGKNFAIIETNGAGSEPTHIYDPKHSLFFAWKEIARHIYYLHKVTEQNHRKGYHYATLKQLLKMYSDYKIYIKEIE